MRVAHILLDSSSNLVYTTTHSVITVLDLRTMRVLQTMENPRQYGPITSMCIDRKRSWIIVGTSTGVLSLWDRRFGLLLKSWHVGIASAGRSVRIHQCIIHPSRGQGRWVMVAVEASRLSPENTSTNLVEVWDIENGTLVETFVTRSVPFPPDPIEEPHVSSGVDADTNPAAAIAALVRSRQALSGSVLNLVKRSRLSSQNTYKDELIPAPAPDVRAMLVGSDFGGHSMMHRPDPSTLTGDVTAARTGARGFMLTGSENRMIRLWDLGNVERTVILSGLEVEHEKPSYRYGDGILFLVTSFNVVHCFLLVQHSARNLGERSCSCRNLADFDGDYEPDQSTSATNVSDYS